MQRIRLVLLCHLSNPIIREHLTLSNNKRYHNNRDIAKWNTDIINGLKNRDDIELHVVSPHDGLVNKTQEFEAEGVRYYFYRPKLPFPWLFFENCFFPPKKNDYRRNRKIVSRFIQKIHPDIINLMGAENPYYSITALDIENTPVILHCQTVYANPDRFINAGYIDSYRRDVELKLFHKIPYIACAGRMHYDLVKKYEPNAIVFQMKWPQSQFPHVEDVPKKYDFVFFARFLNQNKGFDKAIEAMGTFVKKHQDAKFLAVGKKEGNWPEYENRIKELGLTSCLKIHAPFPEYVEVLQYVKQSRFALLPITMDVISGTIFEAMRMGIPVVTCRTSGTPLLNEKRESILISDIGDVEGLVNNMSRLFTDSSFVELLADNATKTIREYDEKNSHNVEYMVEQYKAVIDHYHHGTSIRQELLFNIDENKDYRK